MNRLSHLDRNGSAKMVDVSQKAVTRREARASGRIICRPETLQEINDLTTPKGDPMEISRITGIMAAKEAGRLIPLCHPLPLEHVDVTLNRRADGIGITATVVTSAKTGAEMEALTAVSVTALTLYDMLKAMDKTMIIEAIRLDYKTGGKRGTFVRNTDG